MDDAFSGGFDGDSGDLNDDLVVIEDAAGDAPAGFLGPLEMALQGLQAQLSVVGRRASAVAALCDVEYRLRSEGFEPVVDNIGDLVALTVRVDGVSPRGADTPAARPVVLAVDPVEVGPVAQAGVEGWLNGRFDPSPLADVPVAVWQGIEGRINAVSGAVAADVVRQQAVGVEFASCRDGVAEPAPVPDLGGGNAPAPVLVEDACSALRDAGAAAVPFVKPPVWTAAEDDLLVETVAAHMVAGHKKAVAIDLAAAVVGRPRAGSEYRLRGLTARLNLRVAELSVAAAASAVAASATVSPPVEQKSEPLVAVPRPVVAARPAPVADATVDAAPSPLQLHLESLPKRLGKRAWSRADDLALIEGFAARKKIGEIALDLGVDAALLQGRIDQLIDLRPKPGGGMVGRFGRSDVMDTLRAMVGGQG